jgi:hypothetical protein
MERMRAPEVRLAASPSLPPAFIIGESRLGVGRTGKPSGFNALEVRGDALGLCGLGGSGGDGRLLSQRAGVYDEKTQRFHNESPVRVCHFHRASDSLPVPTPGRLLPCPAWLFEQ